MVIHIDENFKERSERLLVKSLLVWIKMRFATKLKLKKTKAQERAIETILKIEEDMIYPIIMQSDAWMIDRNAALYNAIIQDFLVYRLPAKIFESCGDVSCMVNRRMNVVDICLQPVSSHHTNIVTPCSMLVGDDKAMVRSFKKAEEEAEGDEEIFSNQLDIIPFLKLHIPSFIDTEESDIITRSFNQHKNVAEIVQFRVDADQSKYEEDTNLTNIQTLIKSSSASKYDIYLAITMHNMINRAYNLSPREILKIKFKGTPIAVKQFSQLFIMGDECNLEIIYNVLRTLINEDIKIVYGNNKMLFTTGDTSVIHAIGDITESLSGEIPTVVMDNQEATEDFFTMCVGPVVKASEVLEIVNRFSYTK